MLRLLDLFCGAGGAAMGYYKAGFNYIVGVDIEPQPNYPFAFYQADALEFPLDGFDVIHASPPCQKFTSLKTAWNARAYTDLLTPIKQRLLTMSTQVWVIENVPGAPLDDPLMLCGTMFGLGVETSCGWRELRRHRLFESNVRLKPPPNQCKHRGSTIGIYGDHVRDRRRKPGMRDGGIDFPGVNRRGLAQAALQMPWAKRWSDVSQAVPPAYTHWVGQQLRGRTFP